MNLQRNPKLTVLVETGLSYSELQGVMIKGTAQLITDREVVLEMYGGLAQRYPMVGDREATLTTEELEAAFGRAAEKNTAVRVVTERVISWDHTKIGGGY